MQERQNYHALAWIAATALFMQTLDATILNTALPSISASLHRSPLEMQLAIISYALTVAVFIPLTGWLADKYGTLKIFRSAIAIFMLGSLTCAMSSNIESFILSRVIQGMGGALMMPVARLTIIRTVPKNQLLSVWNLMAMAGLLGPILGPILGGWLVTYATWHWIFLINLPIGAIGIAVASKYMPNSKGQQQPLDVMGFLIFASGLACFTLGIDFIAENGNSLAIYLLIISAIFFTIYTRYAQKIANPLLPLSLFHIRTFRTSIIANLLIRLCGSGVPFLLPLMLQVSFQYSAERSGWLLAPIALSSVLIKPLVRPLLQSLGYKTTLIYTALFLTGSIAAMSLIKADTALWLLITLLMCYGASMSIIFTATNTLAVSELEDDNASSGSTLLSVTQQTGIGVGIAIASMILAFYRQYLGENGEQLQQAFNYTFLTAACFGILLFAVLLTLRKSDGENLRAN